MVRGIKTIAETSKTTSLSEHKIRRGILDGSIEGEKLGAQWVLFPEEVERLEREHPLETLASAS